jgi:galactokinase/mevalonate kinase-like predicted kinase
VRVAHEPVIVLRSIDLGVEERVTRYEDLLANDRAGDAFALTRAALCLAGFHPDFQEGASPRSLREMLETFGGGLEVSLLAAVPKGSGLGTSSILASTLLGTLSDACGLGWDRNSLVPLTVALEQMLTTCGGWQDQAGGIHRGIKHIQTQPGLDQNISLRWLPENDLADAAKSGRALLYYTGLTRMASGTLKEIVRGMFLNSSHHLHILSDIRANASATFEAMLQGNWDELAGCVDRSWRLNCRLDRGTAPDAVRRIFACAADFILGGKLLGAGGGGYALFLAKDEDAGRRLRRALEENCPNRGARFVDFSLSPTGLQITRS